MAVNSNADFALGLFRTLSQANPARNIFVSPLSISSAMAMVYLGAKGDTATQMAKVSTLSTHHMIVLCSFCLCQQLLKHFMQRVLKYSQSLPLSSKHL